MLPTRLTSRRNIMAMAILAALLIFCLVPLTMEKILSSKSPPVSKVLFFTTRAKEAQYYPWQIKITDQKLSVAYVPDKNTPFEEPEYMEVQNPVTGLSRVRINDDRPTIYLYDPVLDETQKFQPPEKLDGLPQTYTFPELSGLRVNTNAESPEGYTFVIKPDGWLDGMGFNVIFTRYYALKKRFAFKTAYKQIPDGIVGRKDDGFLGWVVE